MPITSLREKILNTMLGSSSQMPVYLSQLQKALSPGVKLEELQDTLGDMCFNRELQTCNGFKDGKEYVCYWLSGNLPPAWGKPSKIVAALKKKPTAV